MKNTLKFLATAVVGGALGFVMLGAVALMTGARPWDGRDPDVVAAAGPAQTAPTATEMHGEQMPEGMMMNGVTMGQGKMGGMMPSSMTCDDMCMGQETGSGGMMAEHQEAEKLIGKIVDQFAEIQSEKNPATLRTKLSEQEALLKQLQGKLEESGRMMQKMHDKMMTSPMMNGMKEGQSMKP